MKKFSLENYIDSSLNNSEISNQSWFNDLRKENREIALDAFSSIKKDENWKYNSITKLEELDFSKPAKNQISDDKDFLLNLPILPNSTSIIFINGFFQEKLTRSINKKSIDNFFKGFDASIDKDLVFLEKELRNITKKNNSFTSALNASSVDYGGIFHFRNTTSSMEEELFHILSITIPDVSPIITHPRFVIFIQDGANVNIVESHYGFTGQPYFTNPLVEIFVDKDSKLNHYGLFLDEKDSFNLGHASVSLESGADYSSFVLCLGGNILRREINIELNGTNASAKVDGAYVSSNSQHIDISSEIFHNKPKTMSDQLIKGVLSGESRGIFRGRIFVAQEAQDSDGKQLHKALILNKGPEVDCKPELEIYNDKVKCSHGAATGELDKDQLFYYLSRGVDPETAYLLLIKGFMIEVIDRVKNSQVHEFFLNKFQNWISEDNLDYIRYDE